VKVIVEKQAWQRFLKRVKAKYPKEHIEAIYGHETVEAFRIISFNKVKVTEATSTSIDFDEMEMRRQKWQAEKQGLKYLGTIHSHPHKNSDSSPSKQDYVGAIYDGEKMMGILHIYKRINDRFDIQVDWWLPQAPLNFQILQDE
jgi:proteasome lid subunit RPN8/RPN11